MIINSDPLGSAVTVGPVLGLHSTLLYGASFHVTEVWFTLVMTWCVPLESGLFMQVWWALVLPLLCSQALRPPSTGLGLVVAAYRVVMDILCVRLRLLVAPPSF